MLTFPSTGFTPAGGPDLGSHVDVPPIDDDLQLSTVFLYYFMSKRMGQYEEKSLETLQTAVVLGAESREEMSSVARSARLCSHKPSAVEEGAPSELAYREDGEIWPRIPTPNHWRGATGAGQTPPSRRWGREQVPQREGVLPQHARGVQQPPGAPESRSIKSASRELSALPLTRSTGRPRCWLSAWRSRRGGRVPRKSEL